MIKCVARMAVWIETLSANKPQNPINAQERENARKVYPLDIRLVYGTFGEYIFLCDGY